MRTAYYIAKRYLFAKRSSNVINIISLISVIGVTVGTAGLIIVLSVFNGFSGIVLSLYDSFDPDIRITANTGKTFDPAWIDTTALKSIPGVRTMALTLEENALIKYNDRQFIATLKGVDSRFFSIAKMQDKIIDGNLILNDGKQDFAIPGAGVAYALSLSLNDPFSSLSIYMPRKNNDSGAILSPEDAFNTQLIRPSGVFSIQQDFDSKFVLMPLRFMQSITESENNISAIELGLQPDANAEKIKKEISVLTGTKLKIETRLEQHALLYRILKSEKWAVYFILTFILIIAIFNIAGSLNMLIIEKRRDMAILDAMGMRESVIKNIFMLEGAMITSGGAIAGLLIGGVICRIQQQFGLIRLDSSDSFLISAYPVEMQPLDFILVFLLVSVIGIIASLYTAFQIEKSNIKL